MIGVLHAPLFTGVPRESAEVMAFVLENLTHAWTAATKNADKHDLENWQDFLDKTEKDRARE